MSVKSILSVFLLLASATRADPESAASAQAGKGLLKDLMKCFLGSVGTKPEAKGPAKVFRVDDYGAAAGSGLDAADAFKKAIAAAIASREPAEVVFGRGVYRIGGKGISLRRNG